MRLGSHSVLRVGLQVRQLQPSAVGSWWQSGHPGWAIYPVDSEQFISTGALDSVNVQQDQIVSHVSPANDMSELPFLCSKFKFKMLAPWPCLAPGT